MGGGGGGSLEGVRKVLEGSIRDIRYSMVCFCLQSPSGHDGHYRIPIQLCRNGAGGEPPGEGEGAAQVWVPLINAKWMACVTGRELSTLCAVLPQGPSPLLEERLCPAVSNSGSHLPLLPSQVPLTAAAAAEAEWGKEREVFLPLPPLPWSCAASAAAVVRAIHTREGGVGSGSLFRRIPCKERQGRCDL